jgi:hypothetical protein
MPLGIYSADQHPGDVSSAKGRKRRPMDEFHGAPLRCDRRESATAAGRALLGLIRPGRQHALDLLGAHSSSDHVAIERGFVLVPLGLPHIERRALSNDHSEGRGLRTTSRPENSGQLAESPSPLELVFALTAAILQSYSNPCGRSSIGRALASQAGCRGFESLRPLFFQVPPKHQVVSPAGVRRRCRPAKRRKQ